MYFWVFVVTCFVHLNSSGFFVSPSIVENLKFPPVSSFNDTLYQLINKNNFVTDAKSTLNNNLNQLLNNNNFMTKAKSSLNDSLNQLLDTKNSILEALNLFKNEKSFEELVEETNLQAEKFEVTTEDGYILALYHIVTTNDVKGKVVLLVHGFLDSSDTFIVRKDTSLTKMLVDAGYDVWLMNCRGNKYSRKHTNLNPDVDSEFWNFSFHELGTIDLPTIIQFILYKTEEEVLSIVAHSQGNQITYVMGSENKESNKKVKLAIAMAPVCFTFGLYKSLMQLAVFLYPFLKTLTDLFGYQELLYDRGLLRKLELLVCSIPKIGYPLCVDGILGPVVGFDNEQIEPEFVKELIYNFPTSTSIKNWMHTIQMMKSGQFCLYDYGAEKNQVLYGSDEPRNYELSNVNIKVVLLQAANDFLVPIKNTELLASKLSNVIQFTILDRKQASHIDFVWGRDAKTYVYNHVLDALKNNP